MVNAILCLQYVMMHPVPYYGVKNFLFFLSCREESSKNDAFGRNPFRSQLTLWLTQRGLTTPSAESSKLPENTSHLDMAVILGKDTGG